MSYPPAEDISEDADAKVDAAKALLARAVPLTESSPAWLYLVKVRKLPEAVVRGALDQMPEDLVAQLAQLPHEVPGLAQTEQQGLGGKRPEERRDARAVKRPGRVLDIHAFNGIFEPSV